ncbi:hypothetical protein FSP39_020804 [Pinctada imbricata]|uniref:Integrase core domain-containing protein n=1 Tax=Pinctada imbricata TaxID=66713 RepID=A0AA88XP87_PINIB|nr:hypothetical protein FSP39_020804 [Pinctada imbricata]
MYNENEIRGFLALRHNVNIRKTQCRRIIVRLGLKRNNCEAAMDQIYNEILKLHSAGYRDAGYKTVWRILNTQGIRATQETVRHLLLIMDNEGVELRKHHRLRRRMYSCAGPNHILHIDGYDKLKPYGFPIHGGIDGFSRKILWLKILRSNNNPYVVSRLYFDHLIDIGRIPKIIRSDAGNENVVVADFHKVIRTFHSDRLAGNNSFMTGRSTANQRIEMIWSFLTKHFTQYWRNLFKDLIDVGLLNTADPEEIELIRFCFKSPMQKHLDAFKDYWNSHRIRSQRDVESPTGVAPDVLYHQAELFGRRDCSVNLPVSVQSLIGLRDQFSIEEPNFGCSNEYLRIIWDITHGNLEIPQSSQDGLRLYGNLRTILFNAN